MPPKINPPPPLGARPRRRSLHVAAAGGLVIGMTALVAALAYPSTHGTPLAAADAQTEARTDVAQQLWSTDGQQALEDLRRADRAAVTAAVADVDAFFRRASRGTAAFSQAVLGWQGQWSLTAARVAALLSRCSRLPHWLRWRWLCGAANRVADALDRDAFRKHVRAQLSRHVFSPASLERAVGDARRKFQTRLAAGDQRLSRSFGPPATPAAGPSDGEAAGRPASEASDHAVQRALQRSSTAVDNELLTALVQQAAMKLLTALAAYALKEGAVALGLHAMGTAASIGSAGIGLALAAVANLGLRALMRRYGPAPARAIERQVATELASLRRCVVQGCTRRVGKRQVAIAGLRPKLLRQADERAAKRAEALRRALEGKPTSSS